MGGKALDTTCVPVEFQFAFMNSALFGDFLVHCIWQVVGSLKADMDRCTLMESEIAAVSSAHLQQDLFAELNSEIEIAATVFGLFRKLKKRTRTDERLKCGNFNGVCLKDRRADDFTFFSFCA